MQSLPISNFFNTHLKQIKIALIVAIIMVVGVLITIPIVSFLTTPTLININVVPTTAIVKIDGQNYPAGVSEIPAGQYTAEISADGYQSKTISFEVASRQTTNIQDYLLCDDGTMDCYKQDTTNINIMANFTFDAPDQTFSSFMTKYNNAKNTLSKLPIYEYYSLGSESIYYTAIKDGSSDDRCPTNALCLLIAGNKINNSDLEPIFADNDIDTSFFYLIYENSEAATTANQDVDEIYRYLPYDVYGNGFSVTTDIDSSEHVDKITLDVHVYTCMDGFVNSIKNSFLEWFATTGLDINNYQINYKVCESA